MHLDLCLNYDKSVALRIGKGCNKICCNLKAMGNNIKWVTEAKYLGIYIRSGQKFLCNFDKQKAKFYQAANCIFVYCSFGCSQDIHIYNAQDFRTFHY